MEEVGKTLPSVLGIDVDACRDKPLFRFSNRSVADTILRLASDGSKQISNAIVKPLEEAILGGMHHQAMVFARAGWARFCQRKEGQENVFSCTEQEFHA